MQLQKERIDTHVPKYFQGKAVLIATYSIDRMLSRTFKFQTFYKSLLQIFPYTKFIFTLDLKILWYTVFVHKHQYNHSKLDPKSIKYIFLGYSPNQKDYKCYSPITKKVYNLMDVTFFEHQTYYNKINIQRENMNAHQFWEPQTLKIAPSSSHPPTPSLLSVSLIQSNIKCQNHLRVMNMRVMNSRAIFLLPTTNSSLRSL